jgi:chromosome segregation ATPase
MHKPVKATAHNPLARPLTVAEYATLHRTVQARVGWLLKDHAAALEAEVEQERQFLVKRQARLEVDLPGLRKRAESLLNKIKARNIKIAEREAEVARLDAILAELNEKVAVLKVAEERAKAIIKRAPSRRRGLVSAKTLYAIEATAAEQLAAAHGSLNELTEEAWGSGARRGQKSHAKTAV